MMPAAKHGDPQIGVDIHLCVVPPSPSPVPLPTPHTSIIFDPFDYVPILGATVTVCGMKRAVAGTAGKAIHIPPGFPFAPQIPDTSDELFMGSATVVADGNPLSFLGVPVLSCQVSGMPSPPRPNQQEKKLMLLPTTVNIAIPTNVFVGGPPTISLMGMAFKLGFAALGRFGKSSLFKSIRQKLFGKMKSGFLKCVILRAEPVDITTGEVSVAQEDFTLRARIPLKWARSYGSNNRRDGACGYGWETPADIRLEIYPEDGSAVFLRPGDPAALFPASPRAQGHGAAVLELWDGALLSDHGDEFEIRTKEDRIYHFEKALAFVNKDGAQEHPVSRISDLCGNWLAFDRRGRRLDCIRESAGRCLAVTSDQDDHIRSVTLHVPGTELDHLFVEYDYDRAGDLVEVRDALGNPYRFGYDAHLLIQHTDRNGLSFYYEYKWRGDDGRVVRTWGDSDLYRYRFDWIDEANEVRITDSVGHVSVVTFDERRLPIGELDPLGGISTYEYDEVGRTTAVVDQDGQRTEYGYDERGNLLTLTRPDGSVVASEFDAKNKVVTIIDALGGKWHQAWDRRGLLVRQTSPLGNVSVYEHDQFGQLVRFINAGGARTELVFDNEGNVVIFKDPLGNRVQFEYDAPGNLTCVTDSLGQSAIYSYDAASRPISVRRSSGATVRRSYDPEGNLTHHFDENDVGILFEYFGQGEIARRVQPDGITVEYLYDTEERLVGIRNQRGEVYQLKRDALGRITEEIDYFGQSRRYVYTPGGRLTSSVDPLGRRIDYATDSLGRIVKRELPEGVVEESDYDANGNLTRAKNACGEITRNFDVEGRLLEETQDQVFTIQNAYDAAGNRIERRTTLGNTVKYCYDLCDNASSVQINETEPIRIERDTCGQIVRESLAPMLLRHRRYDADGLLSQQTVAAGETLLFATQYDYDHVGNLTRRRDSQCGIDRYRYDLLGRILQDIDPQGRVSDHSWDPVGGRLDAPVFERDSNAQVCMDAVGFAWDRKGEHCGTHYRFDRAGNLVERLGSGDDLQLVWTCDQRLVESRRNGVITRYGYDPLGRRLFKQTGNVRTRFFWDQDALIGEAVEYAGERDKKQTREYIHYPETFEPLALVLGDGARLLLYHNDPIGCPMRITDRTGHLLWAGRYTARGDVTTTTVAGITNPIRLQGQYYDEESGISYNRHRYYDPSIGQFISQDPLGIAAGERLYLFGPNIWRWTDPLGLSCAPKLSEAKKLVSRWEKGTFDTLKGSILYHWEKHLPEKDVWTYLRKAADFNKKGAVRKFVEDGIVRYERKSGEYLMERDGKIVSYGFNKLSG